MTQLNWLWNEITVERVKAVAAFLQAVGVIVAACLSYQFARMLERHKYKIRVSEIMFTKFLIFFLGYRLLVRCADPQLSATP